MAQVALDVFVLNPHLKGETANPQFGEADIRWLFDAKNKRSFTRYWSEASGGLIEIDATVHPALTVEVSSASWAELTATGTNGGRERGVPEAARLLAAAGRVSQGNPSVLFIGGPQVDSGSWGAVAYLDMHGQHSHDAHEIGHLLGLDHPYDFRLPGSWADREYGDPADIMSARKWKRALFAAPPGDRGFAPAAPLWEQCGPGASPVSLWRYSSTFPAVPRWVRRVEPGAPPTRVVLHRAGSSAATNTLLVAMPGKAPGTWLSAQYKVRRDWDVNVYADRFPKAKGIVQLHYLCEIAREQAEGKPPITVFAPVLRDEIALPGANLDTSLLGEFAVRVESFDEHAVRLLVGSQLPDTRSLRLEVESASIDEHSQPIGETVDVSRAGPGCEVRPYEPVLHLSRCVLTATAQAQGFSAPVFRFEANGVRLGGWVRAKESVGPTRTDVPATVSRQTSLSSTETEARTVGLTYEIQRNVLTLTTGRGEGRFEVAVKALVSESPGDETNSVEAIDIVAIATREITLPAEVAQDQAACLLANLDKARVDDRMKRPLEEPDWLQFARLLEEQNLEEAGPLLLQIIDSEHQDRHANPRLMIDAAAMLGVTPDALRQVGQHFVAPP